MREMQEMWQLVSGSRPARMIPLSEDEVSAFHEAAHCVIGTLIGVPVAYATIVGKAHVTLCFQGVLKIALSEDHRATFFLAGTVVQKYYFPDEPATNKKDEYLLWGLPENRRRYYTDFINSHLENPDVRAQIERIAKKLLSEKNIRF
jgi:hypothetical protein